MELLDPDCPWALRRKGRYSLAWAFGQILSPVRFENENCGIAPISSDFSRNAAEFLCNPDCMAEREGFYLRHF
jgi:hypothetical protein